MESRFIGKSILTLENDGNKKTSRVVSVDIKLDYSENIDRSVYLENGLPNKLGTKALTQSFIQGLVANIHQAHQKGMWNDAEHLRYIISELERGFAEIVEE